MSIEIERKFLAATASWRTLVVSARHIKQAYLCTSGLASIRVRLEDDAGAVLTVKSAEAGPSRQEFEYSIPAADAAGLFALRQGAIIEKVRHDVPYGGQMWEVDVFLGENDGLVVAEIELERADQDFDRPAWLGEEITHDQRYYNAELARHPFSRW